MMLNITILTVAVFTILGCGPKATRTAPNTGHEPKSSTAWTAAWSHDDKYVAVGNDKGELAIYETKDWKRIKSWKYASTTITRVEWNPRNSILAVASISHIKNPSVIQLYDIVNDKVITTLPDTLQGRCVSWSPDGESLAYVGSKGRISILSWEGKHRKTLSFTHPNSIMDLDWHPTKNLLLLVEEDMYVIDIDQDSLLASYDDGSKNKGILCCQWHPSGDLFVTGDYGHENEGGEPSYLKYWTGNGVLVKRIKESGYEYRNVKWTRDGRYLAATGDVLLVLDKKANLVSKTRFDGNNLWGLDWNSKGDRLISSDQAGNIRVSDINGKILKRFKI